MARKKERASAPEMGTLELNMTPMIDVVFNLIIFFMVITDMTQQDLEYLILPKAEQAVEDKGEDKSRLVINIVDPASRGMKGRIDPSRPPVFFEGVQVESLDSLRAALRRRADPRLYPEKKKPDGTEIRPLPGPGGVAVYPSSKPLIVRCDQGQIFGWVQAVMQVAMFIPGRPEATELVESPLIYKIEIATAERKSDDRE